MGLSRGDHIVLGHVLLEHEPHALDVVARVAPVTGRVQVAKVHAILVSVLRANTRIRTAKECRRWWGLGAGRFERKFEVLVRWKVEVVIDLTASERVGEEP